MRSGPEYEEFRLKTYKWWDVFLDGKKQYPFVGRCYAWWIDKMPGEGERMPQWRLPRPALDELYYRIMPHIVQAHAALGYRVSIKGDDYRLNECCLANERTHNHHLHYHFIPRTMRPIFIRTLGVRCTDPINDRNYTTPFEETSELRKQREFFSKVENVLKVRDIMREALA